MPAPSPGQISLAVLLLIAGPGFQRTGMVFPKGRCPTALAGLCRGHRGFPAVLSQKEISSVHSTHRLSSACNSFKLSAVWWTILAFFWPSGHRMSLGCDFTTVPLQANSSCHTSRGS